MNKKHPHPRNNTSQTQTRQQSKRLTNIQTGHHEDFRFSEEFFAQVLDSLQDYAVFTTDTQGHISSWNSGAEYLLGYSAGEIIGQNAAVLFTAEDRKSKQPEKEVEEALKEGRANAERYHIRKDGRYFWASALLFPLADEQGNVRGFTKVMRDLTERKEVREQEERIKAEQGRLYRLFMQAPIPIAILRGPDHIYELSNSLTNSVLQVDDPIGKSVKELFPDNKDLIKLLDVVYKTGKPFSVAEHPINLEVPGKGPHTIYVNATYQPLRDDHGEIEGIMTTGVEVTEQVLARQKVEESEERFRQLAETTRVIPWESDLETGIFTYVGPQAKALLGYPLEQWYEPTFWSDHIHPDDRAWVVQYCLDSSKKTPEYEFEYRMIDAKGKSIWLRDIVNVVEGKDKRKKLRGFMLDITERKRYEDELKESELRFRNLADTAPMYIAMADETGNAVYFNKPWLEFTGNSLEGVLGLGWLCTLHPEDAPKFERDFKHAFKRHISIHEQYRFRRADGEYRWMLAVGAPRFTPDGRFIGYFGTYTDFHELKEAQLAVQESEARFRQLAETIPHIVFSANADGKVEYLNQKWFEYSGAPRDFDPDAWAMYIHPDDISSLLSVWEQGKRQGGNYEAEYRLKRYDGIYRWHVARSSPIKNPQGKIARWFGTATDIDDKRQAEKNLRYLAEASKVLSSSLDFKTTLNNIAKLAVPEIADWCGIDILVRKEGLEQVAVAHKDPKKIKWAKELRKKYPPDMQAATGIPKVIKTGEAEFYPSIPDDLLVKIAKDAEHLKFLRDVGFTSAMVVPLCREGTCIGAITFVTAEARRQYNESDLKMAQDLAARASLAIDNAWLYKASQEAVALRDDFISIASHELKTPVTSVKIFTQVLQRHSEQIGDQKASDHLRKMDRQLNKLTELIYNMLDISKIQVGRMELNQHAFDFDTAIKDVVDVLQRGSTTHKIIIEGQTQQKVYGDEDRIGQVVSNLISNAIKYSPKANKVIIRLECDGETVTCGVQDLGIGIAKQHLGRIFERFYRVFDATDKTFPGLGIGLYISAEIVQRHNGRLWVESSQGQGSTFYISLPIYQ